MLLKSSQPSARSCLATVNAASWDDTLAGRAARGVLARLGRRSADQRLHRVGRRSGAERHGIDLVHVKLTDTAEAVARVVAEKAAGTTEGAVDLIWINGENFASMKAQDLLFGPSWRTCRTSATWTPQGKPTTLVDFTVPTDGLEAPRHGPVRAFYDTAPSRSRRARSPPARMGQGQSRTLHLSAPDFIGSTFRSTC